MIGSAPYQAFLKLGEYLRNIPDSELKSLVIRAYNQNKWFDEGNIRFAIQQFGEALKTDELTNWLKPYGNTSQNPKTIGVVMAGNIPLVGFADAMAVLLSGHTLMAKLSSDDRTLILFCLEKLIEFEPALASKIKLVEKINEAEAVIATGSDNTAKHFEYYFKNKPHIIRRNRVSIAIINGNESTEELNLLGRDIFQYYGLGCRNVAKLYIPEGYNFTPFFEAIESWRPVIDHHKYNNNYEYNRAIYLLKKITHLDNGFIILTETTDLVSPIATVYYETYTNAVALQTTLNTYQDKIQCIVSNQNVVPNAIKPGNAQSPHLWDYADGIDTMKFLLSL